MKAARRFAQSLHESHPETVERIRVELLGSLGATGQGHASDTAVILGLSGHEPESIDPDQIPFLLERIRKGGALPLFGDRPVAFDGKRDLFFDGTRSLPQHPNGMIFTAFDKTGNELASETWFSVGGGFILSLDEAETDSLLSSEADLPYPFDNAAELLDRCHQKKCTVSDLMLANEIARGRSEEAVRRDVLAIWKAMQESVRRGTRTDGMLPGPLNLHRRAPSLFRKLQNRPRLDDHDPLAELDWIDLYALAVGEENACGGRVVTAPTNGASGVIPAVLHYCVYVLNDFDEDRVVRFFLTAAAIGSLYKKNASLSAAEVGCQGEIGVACSMAAGALCEVREGMPEQVQNAAEIAMEHNLGLTCDPIGGLVQIPCIERNAMGAVKAINATRMALRRDRPQYVSLDSVIKTMRDTGRDMSRKYKETSEGGLAVNVPEC